MGRQAQARLDVIIGVRMAQLALMGWATWLERGGMGSLDSQAVAALLLFGVQLRAASFFFAAWPRLGRARIRAAPGAGARIVRFHGPCWPQGTIATARWGGRLCPGRGGVDYKYGAGEHPL